MNLQDQLSKMIAEAEEYVRQGGCEGCEILAPKLIALAKWARNLHATASDVEDYMDEWCDLDNCPPPQDIAAFRAALSAPLEVEE